MERRRTLLAFVLHRNIGTWSDWLGGAVKLLRVAYLQRTGIARVSSHDINSGLLLLVAATHLATGIAANEQAKKNPTEEQERSGIDDWRCVFSRHGRAISIREAAITGALTIPPVLGPLTAEGPDGVPWNANADFTSPATLWKQNTLGARFTRLRGLAGKRADVGGRQSREKGYHNKLENAQSHVELAGPRRRARKGEKTPQFVNEEK